MDRNEDANSVGSVRLRLPISDVGEDNVEPHSHAPRIILIFMPGTSLSTVAHMHCQAVEAEAAVLSARADGMAGVAEARTVG